MLAITFSFWKLHRQVDEGKVQKEKSKIQNEQSNLEKEERNFKKERVFIENNNIIPRKCVRVVFPVVFIFFIFVL